MLNFSPRVLAFCNLIAQLECIFLFCNNPNVSYHVMFHFSILSSVSLLPFFTPLATVSLVALLSTHNCFHEKCRMIQFSFCTTGNIKNTSQTYISKVTTNILINRKYHITHKSVMHWLYCILIGSHTWKKRKRKDNSTLIWSQGCVILSKSHSFTVATGLA